MKAAPVDPLALPVDHVDGRDSPAYSPTSPSYSPTSPTLGPVPEAPPGPPRRVIKLPSNWREHIATETMEKLISSIAYLAESHEKLILDIHHGNEELMDKPPKMGIGQYVRLLQPKNEIDVLMTNFMDKMDEAEKAERVPPSVGEKRSRSL